MGLKISTNIITPTNQIINKKQKTHDTKVKNKAKRKRVAGIDYNYYGNELNQEKGEVSHVEFLSRDLEGIRFSVCGHFAIYYKDSSPEIALFINPNKFIGNNLSINDEVITFVYTKLDWIIDEMFNFVASNKDKFIIN